MSNYLLPTHPLDFCLLKYLDYIEDYPIIMILNKYYYKLLTNDVWHCKFIPGWLSSNMEIHRHGRPSVKFLVTCDDSYFTTAKYIYYKSEGKDLINLDEIFADLCEYECLGSLKWLIKFAKRQGKEINIHYNYERAFTDSCKGGFLEQIEWLVNLGIETNSPIEMRIHHDRVFRTACEEGNIDMIELLLTLGEKNGTPYNINEFMALKKHNSCYPAGHGDKPFTLICQHGDINMVERFLNFADRLGNPVNLSLISNDAFLKICSNGHCRLAKWFLNLCIDKQVQTGLSFDDAFMETCDSGYLTTAKWLSEWISDYIFDNLNVLFFTTCRHNSIRFAKWLYDYSIQVNHPININYEKDKAFRQSCYGGNIKIAKWLLELGNELGTPIDIRQREYRALTKSCDNRHSNVVEWLLRLHDCPINGYHIDPVIGNKIFYSCCSSGLINAAKLIIEIGNKSNYCFDKPETIIEGFIKAHVNNRVKMCEWLTSIEKYSMYLCESVDFEELLTHSLNHYAMYMVEWLVKFTTSINKPIKIKFNKRQRILDEETYKNMQFII